AAWLTWLETATWRVAYEFRRGRSTRPLDVRDPAELADAIDDRDHVDPSAVVQDAEPDVTKDILQRATRPELWRVFDAYARGVPMADIAAAEQIPEATAYNRLRQA